MKNYFSENRLVYMEAPKAHEAPKANTEKVDSAKRKAITFATLGCKDDVKLPELKAKAKDFMKKFKDNPPARIAAIKTQAEKYVRSSLGDTSALEQATRQVDDIIQKLALEKVK